MNRRDYFLACLNVHLSSGAMSAFSMRPDVVAIQAEAWRVPEEAIPLLDPAGAALEFFEFMIKSGAKPPEWLAAWEESLGR